MQLLPRVPSPPHPWWGCQGLAVLMAKLPRALIQGEKSPLRQVNNKTSQESRASCICLSDWCFCLWHNKTVQGLCFWREGHTVALQDFYYKDAFLGRKIIQLFFDIDGIFYMIPFYPVQGLYLHGSSSVSRSTLFCLFAHNNLLCNKMWAKSVARGFLYGFSEPDSIWEPQVLYK